MSCDGWLVCGGAARVQRARNTLRHNATMFVRNSGTAQGEAGKKIGKKKWYRILRKPWKPKKIRYRPRAVRFLNARN